MRSALLIRLLDPIAGPIARQLSRPTGWFGRVVMTRVLNRGNHELVQATLDAAELSPGCRLLDVGFGGGLLLELAHQRGIHLLAGVDPSEAALAWMAGRREHLVGSELRLELGAVEALPFEDGSFDVVASTNTVYFWPDLRPPFAELYRVLRPGGLLSVGFSGAEKLRRFGTITRRGFHLRDPAALVAAASGAGFERIGVVDLHGRVTRGDHVLRAARPAR